MKAIITKILLFFRDLFLHLRVAVVLHIGKNSNGKEEHPAHDGHDEEHDETEQL